MHRVIFFSILLSTFCLAGIAQCTPQSISNGSPCSQQTPATPISFCANINPNGVSYPSTVNGPNTSLFTGSSHVGCCLTTPNPAWYYFQIDNPGSLTIHIEQHSTSGAELDVDFICWGPFIATSQNDFLNNLCCGVYTVSDQAIVDCGFSVAAVENCNLGDVQSGQWYLLLITNYSDQAGTVNFNSTANSTATTNCDLLNSASSNSPVCAGDTLELYVSIPQPGATYHWTGPNGFSRSTTDTILYIPNATEDMAGEYHMSMTGITQNSNEAVVDVTIYPTPTPQIVANHAAICIGEDVQLTASGNHPTYSYRWSAKALQDGVYSIIATNQSSIVVNPVESFRYVLTAEENGCTGSDSINIIVNPNPEIEVTVENPALCNGESTTITAYGGTQYLWSTGSTGNATQVTPIQTTSYSVEGFSDAMCSSTVTVEITVYPGNPQSTSNGSPCSLETPATPFCTDENPFGITYPSTTNSPSSAPFTGSTQVSCCYTTPNPAWYYFQINDPGTLTIHIEQHSMSGSGLDVDFVCWGPFEAVSQTDFTTKLCCGAYNISNSSVVDCSYSAAAVEDCNFGYVQSNQWYLLLLTNYSNQPGTINFNATSSSTATTNCNLLNSGDSNSPVCEGGTLSLYVTSPVNGATYNWTGPNGFAQSTTHATLQIHNVTPDMSGEYHMTMSGISHNSNEAVVDVTINPKPTPEIVGDHDAICLGDSVHLNAGGNHPGYSYTWAGKRVSDVSYSVIARYVNSILVEPTESYSYILTAEANECLGRDTFDVIVNYPPDIKVTVSDPYLCYGGSSLVTVSGGSHYHWSNGSTSNTILVSPEQTTSYTVEIQTDAMCEGDTTVEIVVYPEISLSYDVLPSFCGSPTGEIVMHAIGGAGNFVYTSKHADFAGNIAGMLPEGAYLITASDSVGCDVRTVVEVPSVPGVTACFFFTSTDDVNMSITNCTQGNNNNYFWDFGDGVTSSETHPMHEYMDPGRYSVNMVVIDENNCIDSLRKDYIINGPVYIPNAFTPNGDGINDEISVIGKSILEEDFIWVIYDRHGSLVFMSLSPSIGWDGTLFDGHDAIPGMYVYRLKYKDVNGNHFERDGSITLIR